MRHAVSDAVSKILVSSSHFFTLLRHEFTCISSFLRENLGWFQCWKAFSTNYHPYSSSFTSINIKLSCNEATGLLLIIFPSHAVTKIIQTCHIHCHLLKRCATKALENNWWPHPGKRDLQPLPMQAFTNTTKMKEHPGALRLFSTCAKESAQMTCKLASLHKNPLTSTWMNHVPPLVYCSTPEAGLFGHALIFETSKKTNQVAN